jgi:hexosaminidase
MVHMDLKGAPPSLSFLQRLLPIFKRHHVTSLLLEYEDAFPFQEPISFLRSQSAYKWEFWWSDFHIFYCRAEELCRFLKVCEDAEISVIPLVQTFGHFEVKHTYSIGHIAEIARFVINALCTTYCMCTSITLIWLVVRFQFALKHSQLLDLRESTDHASSLCPSKNGLRRSVSLCRFLQNRSNW